MVPVKALVSGTLHQPAAQLRARQAAAGKEYHHSGNNVNNTQDVYDSYGQQGVEYVHFHLSAQSLAVYRPECISPVIQVFPSA
jgi:hypothetical protein